MTGRKTQHHGFYLASRLVGCLHCVLVKAYGITASLSPILLTCFHVILLRLWMMNEELPLILFLVLRDVWNHPLYL